MNPILNKVGCLALSFDILHPDGKFIPETKLNEALKGVAKSEFKTTMLYRVRSEKFDSNLDYL